MGCTNSKSSSAVSPPNKEQDIPTKKESNNAPALKLEIKDINKLEIENEIETPSAMKVDKNLEQKRKRNVLRASCVAYFIFLFLFIEI